MNVREKIANGDYENKTEYPKPPKRECECGKSFFHDAPKFCPDCGASVKDGYDVLFGEYKVLITAYRAKDNELMDEFEKNALEECGLTNHARRDKAFSMVHSSSDNNGLNYVIDALEELSELML